MPMSKRALAEFFGTFWLVFGGCGAAVLAASFPAVGIGFAGVALAFGLTVLTMAYAIGHISGCHLNPAVSLGLVFGKRFPASELLGYVIAQLLGAIAAAGVLYIIASGSPGFDVRNGFACNGYGVNSPGCRSGADRFLPYRDHGCNGRARAQRIRSGGHRVVPHSDSPDRNSGDECLRKSGAQHRPGAFCRWVGFAGIMAVLGGAPRRRRSRRPYLQRAVWQQRQNHRRSGSDPDRRKSQSLRRSPQRRTEEFLCETLCPLW